MAKIVHVSLIGIVTDYLTYQDNLLPKYHKIIGNEVVMITSKYIYNQKGEHILDNRNVYYNEYGIKTIRLNILKNKKFNSKFKKYENLYEMLEDEKPEILFIHGVQFVDIKTIVKYLKSNAEVKVYIDNHADFSNSANNWLSKNILHKIIWKYFAQLISPYTTKYYGVLPSRVSFMTDLYNLPKNMVDLLVMGVDDELINKILVGDYKQKIKKKYNIKPEDFLIVTGGKIDNEKKEVLNLIKSVNRIKNKNIKLIIFGSIHPDLKEEFNSLLNKEKINYIGWIDNEESYKVFSTADIVVFPGRHSVYWEQVVGLGIPIIVKYWEGTQHIDLDGNCIFLYKSTVEEIKDVILSLYNDKSKLEEMKDVSLNKGMKYFSYKEIAEKSINQ